MRIAIDCRELRGQSGGFRTYILGLLEGLSKVDNNNDYLLYAYDSSVFSNIALPAKSTIRVVAGGRLISDWFTMRSALLHDQPDMLHFPANYGIIGVSIPKIITLHDCLAFDRKQKCTSAKSEIIKRYFAIMTQITVPQANALITVSKYSSQQITKHFGALDNLVVIYEAARALSCPEHDEGYKGLHNIPESYMLALASVDRRKNTDAVIRAFSMARNCRDICKLVIVASHGSARAMTEKIAAESGLQDHIIILSEVSDAGLRQLYRNCVAFIYPSLDEGFGLPPLEAINSGAVVLSSDKGSLPEILGDAALYFDPLDYTDIAAKMDLVLAQGTLKDHLKKKGTDRIAQYSWESCARQTLDTYKSLVSSQVK